MLRDAARWQPQSQRVLAGIYKVQEFVTPQYALVEPYAIKRLAKFRVPPPSASLRPGSAAYRKQAAAVLAATAALTDEKKANIEFWDSKLNSLGRLSTGLAAFRGASLFDAVAFGFMVNLAAFDAGARLPPLFSRRRAAALAAAAAAPAQRVLRGRTRSHRGPGPGRG